MSRPAKLIALDETDLNVISAHVQDAVLRVGDIKFDRNAAQLSFQMNRYVWEAKGARRWLFPHKERRRAVLHFDRALSIRSRGVDQSNPDAVLSLLTVRFVADPDAGSAGGEVEFIFGGDAAITAHVECLEAKLTDVGGAWSASAKPDHGFWRG